MGGECTREARHFDIRRRSTSPTAIGRWPPFFFLLARSEAPQRCGVMVGGARPAARRLTKLVRKARIRFAWSGEGQPTASRRWLGRRPEGPGAEPLGKDPTPPLTAVSLRLSGGGTGPGGRGEGGRGSLAVLVHHLPQDLSRGSGQTVRGQGLDGSAVLAILNSQLSSPDVVTPLRS